MPRRFLPWRGLCQHRLEWQIDHLYELIIAPLPPILVFVVVCAWSVTSEPTSAYTLNLNPEKLVEYYTHEQDISLVTTTQLSSLMDNHVLSVSAWSGWPRSVSSKWVTATRQSHRGSCRGYLKFRGDPSANVKENGVEISGLISSPN